MRHTKLRASEAAKNALQNVFETKSNERILITCDEEKMEIGKAFVAGALELEMWTRLVILHKQKMPRTMIPRHLQRVLAQKPDIYINLLSGSREETQFRIKLIKIQTHKHKLRLGHCPGVTYDMLTEGALALTSEKHKKMQKQAQKLIDALSDTVAMEISNQYGTNLTLHTQNRKFFTDTKIDWKTMKWMNLPTGEVIVAPEENSLNGKLVCDMAIGGIGKIKKPIEVTAKNGKVEGVISEDKINLQRVKKALETDKWASVVGELAFGINPKARFVDEFLEAEKMLGTVHIAFGANTDMPGGKNPSKNHMDMLISKPTIKVTKKDEETFVIIEKGVFKI